MRVEIASRAPRGLSRAVAESISVLGLCSLLAACEARPIPMVVMPNSSFLLPLQAPAFGNSLSKSLGVEDRQRGDLVVAICPTANPYCSPPAVAGSCDEPPDEGFYLTTQYVTRVMPDPASNAGLRNYLNFPNNPIGEPNRGLLGQDLALLWVPANACPGYYVLSVRARSVGSEPGQNEAVYAVGVAIAVLAAPPGAGIGPNPLSANPLGYGDINIDPDLVDLVPNPTTYLRLYDPFSTSTYPAAAEVGVNYPTELVQILGAYQDKHLGIKSVVSWIDDPDSGRVTVSVVDPDRCTGDLRIVFRLRTSAAVNVLTAFTTTPQIQRLYDMNGAPISGNPYVVANPSPPTSTTSLFCGSGPTP